MSVLVVIILQKEVYKLPQFQNLYLIISVGMNGSIIMLLLCQKCNVLNEYIVIYCRILQLQYYRGGRSTLALVRQGVTYTSSWTGKRT